LADQDLLSPNIRAFMTGDTAPFLNRDALGRQKHRDVPDPDWAEVVVHPSMISDMQEILEQARDAELVNACSAFGARGGRRIRLKLVRE
jgi:hypothetical protein